MIMKDFRYIIKRILIGIGIIVGISMIKSCNVYAQVLPTGYTLTQLTNTSQQPNYNPHSVGDTYNFEIADYNYLIEYKSNGLYVNNHLISSDANVLNHNWVIGAFPNSDTITFYYVYGSVNGGNPLGNASLYIQNISNFNGEFPVHTNTIGTSFASSYRKRVNFTNGSFVSENISQTNYCINGYCNFLNGYDFDVYGFADWSGFVFSSSNTTYYRTDFSNPIYNYPQILSLNAQLNKTDDNMLVSVSFSPEFSYIDTENYNYYAWFEGEQKYNIIENNVSFNTQSNTTFYVEIRDKQDNYIDSQTYTVTSIGLVYNGDYDIQFKNEEYTESDTENDSDALFDIINRIDIDILYIPKWVNYKYEYQWVSYGDSPTDNWILVNDNNDNNNVVYTTRENGTLYARILDSDNNLLKSATFTITRIGSIKTYDKNTDKFYGMFNIIKNNLNFGGPISDLIVIPVNVLQSISNASNKVCTPYDLGSIGGHHIVLPCIEPEHYLGSALWTTIDLIFSGCMFFAISKWFTSAYYKFILLDNTPGIKERRDLD